MIHLPTLDAMQLAIRSAVCPGCFRCPAELRVLRDGTPRPCEADCSIFGNLAQVREIAGRVREGLLGPYRSALRELICQNCEASLGDHGSCNERTARACPLSRYLSQVIDALDALPRAQPA
jgi:hypothetical protein